MANNPYINKVVYGSNTLIDLTSDSVTSNCLLAGYTAHDKSGALIQGLVDVATSQDIQDILDGSYGGV